MRSYHDKSLQLMQLCCTQLVIIIKSWYKKIKYGPLQLAAKNTDRIEENLIDLFQTVS